MTRAVFQLQIPRERHRGGHPRRGDSYRRDRRDQRRRVHPIGAGRAGPAAHHPPLSAVKYLDSAGFAALDRLLEQNAIVLVLSPDSFMYRVAELMCLPIHHDAEAARRVLQENAT